MDRESSGSGLKTIYLGNLPTKVTEQDLRSLCGEFGDVAEVLLVHDRETGLPRGFGFVKMVSAAAEKAVEALDGAEYEGQTLRANEARDRGAKPPRRAW